MQSSGTPVGLRSRSRRGHSRRGAHGMTDEWTQPARRELLRLRGGEAGWGYRAGATPGVEPTALAVPRAARLRARRPAGRRPRGPRGRGRLARGDPAPDGSLGLSATQPTPGWTTPYALLLWKALATREPGVPRRPMAARDQGPGDPSLGRPRAHRRARHDAGRVALGRRHPLLARTDGAGHPGAGAGRARRHPRVVEGLRLIRDRAVDTGGWNCGNKATFGRGLRPQPAPTGLALLTLADTGRAPLAARRSGDPLPDRDSCRGCAPPGRSDGDCSGSAPGA